MKLTYEELIENYAPGNPVSWIFCWKNINISFVKGKCCFLLGGDTDDLVQEG